MGCMLKTRNDAHYERLVRELLLLPKEVEWVEFKENKLVPEEIGQYISALANSAALEGKVNAYMVWGVSNESHEIVGTSVKPTSHKVGQEELENWLLRLLQPKIEFRFHNVTVDENQVVVLEIGRAFRHPVKFKGQEFIRVGSYKKQLKDFPEKERTLWKVFDQTPFEVMVAAEGLAPEAALSLLDYPRYFDLLEVPLPDGRESVLEALSKDSMVERSQSGNWNITNLGAVLFAKNLEEFPTLRRKTVRVITYKGNNRVQAEREQVGKRGYAAGFEELIALIEGQLPVNEEIGAALRKEVPMYPELAVRELVANALIHQDFFVGGTGPMIEIFDNRMEITNPGTPLVETSRLLDSPPRSRNEALASFLRRVGICEERGSGIDKVVWQTEFYQLPAPVFEDVSNSTRAVLFAHQDLKDLAKEDRIRACYFHACLRYVARDYMTNASLRQRFGIPTHNSATASRLIKEAVESDAIKPYDKEASKRMMKYVPIWA